jgi:hypothetical protein
MLPLSHHTLAAPGAGALDASSPVSWTVYNERLDAPQSEEEGPTQQTKNHKPRKKAFFNRLGTPKYFYAIQSLQLEQEPQDRLVQYLHYKIHLQ